MQFRPSYYTFFDVDGTIINIKSIYSFLKYFYVAKFGLLGIIKFYVYNFNTFLLEKLGVSRKYLNTRYYNNFKNCSVKSIEALGKKWFEQKMKENQNLFFNNILHEIKKHKYNNAEIVLVSGSFPACLKPIAEYLNISTILSTRLETINGRFTGKVLQQTIGKGKAEAIRQFLHVNKYSQLEQCYAYGDHVSDIEMLNMVGNPRVVAGDKNIESYANKNGWEIIKKSN